jgi:hypothetical protein
MGWRKFKKQYGKHLDDKFCEAVKRVYREDWAPGVPWLWRGLEHDAFRALGRPDLTWGGYSCPAIEWKQQDGWLTARLPSGRPLWYRNARVEERLKPWFDDDGEPVWRPTMVYDGFNAGGLMKTQDCFGGSLCENVVMGIEADIHRHGWRNAERAGFPIVYECYDELVAEVPEWDADLKGFEKCLLDQPQWVRDLRIPVAVESWMGSRYRKG